MLNRPNLCEARRSFRRASSKEMIAKEVGIEAAEVDLSVAALQDADEAFLTTTAGGLLPIATVNGATLGSAPGSVTGRLHGEDWGRRASGWLSSPALYW